MARRCFFTLSALVACVAVAQGAMPPGPTHPGVSSNCTHWHVVKSGESCATLEGRYSITHAQFLAWNPAVSKDCLVDFWPDYAYCVGLDPPVTSKSSSPSSNSTSSISNSTSSISSSTLSISNSTFSIRHPITSWAISTPTVDDTTWPPTRTQAGQPGYCNTWHLVSEHQNCHDIWFMHRTWMTLADFFAWNPAVGSDCSGLYLNYYVCVGIVPQTVLTIEMPTATKLTLPPYFSWTPKPLPPVNTSFTPTPSHGPMPSNCVNFYRAEPGKTCDSILAEHREITREQFLNWNPVLDGNCNGLWADNYYCVGAYASGNLPQPPTVRTKPSPVPPDSASNCVAWYKATDGDTCADIATIFGSFSDQSFKTWNPAVGGGCSGIQVGYWYCVAVPGTPTTRTTLLSPSSSSVVSSTKPQPAPTASGAVVATPQPTPDSMITRDSTG